MLEHRRYQRWQLGLYLQVFDQKSNFPVGKIVNVSLGGLRLTHHEALAQGNIYQLWMEAPVTTATTERVVFEARCAWVSRNAEGAGYDAGMEFFNLSPNSIEFFRELITYVSTNGAGAPT